MAAIAYFERRGHKNDVPLRAARANMDLGQAQKAAIFILLIKNKSRWTCAE
jgi:hypothetical protein